jgi:hypothetical protein
MKKETMEKMLNNENYDQEWLMDVYNNFKPLKAGKHKIIIFDEWLLDVACFTTREDLEEILKYYEGNYYREIDSDNTTIKNSGILDGWMIEEYFEEG